MYNTFKDLFTGIRRESGYENKCKMFTYFVHTFVQFFLVDRYRNKLHRCFYRFLHTGTDSCLYTHRYLAMRKYLMIMKRLVNCIMDRYTIP